MDPLYFDHAATTPLDPEVLDAMLPFLGRRFGNPSSLHASGRDARHAVETARMQIAAACRTEPESVLFTGSGTEADNLAVLGTLALRKGNVLSSPVEHEAVLAPLRHAVSQGRSVDWLPVRADGSVDAADAGLRVAPGLALVSVMAVNNETGAVNDVARLGKSCREAGVPFHVDAVQAAPWYRVGPDDLHADLVSLSAHKVSGPKGVGALLVRPGTEVAPLLLGGSQERRRRAGTENVAGIVGFGIAMERVAASRDQDVARVAGLARLLRSLLREGCGDVFRLVEPADAAPHIVYGFADGPSPIDPEMLLLRLDIEGVQASAGSACSSGALERGHVPAALGARGAPLRLSLGRTTTREDVVRGAEIVNRVVCRLAETANR